jgi:short-subunit dehydrogenase
MNYFKDKTVLITGAYGGFGRFFTDRLAEAGAKLILSDVVIPSDNNPKTKGRIMAAIQADLATSEGCTALYEEVMAACGTPDVIIHNAGIAYIGTYADIPLDKNEQVIQINLLSVMRLNSLFLPGMIERKSGHLIYVSSVAGFVSTPFAVSYTTSKFGLRSMAMATHGEIRRYGVRTSITYPFWAKTPIMKSRIFGKPEMKTMPDFFASDPDDVVRVTLQGAARGKLHIHPGIFSKLMWQAVRFIPVIAPQRHMRHDLIV